MYLFIFGLLLFGSLLLHPWGFPPGMMKVCWRRRRPGLAWAPQVPGFLTNYMFTVTFWLWCLWRSLLLHRARSMEDWSMLAPAPSGSVLGAGGASYVLGCSYNFILLTVLLFCFIMIVLGALGSLRGAGWRFICFYYIFYVFLLLLIMLMLLTVRHV